MNADVYLAVALNQATSEVKRGENSGHTLTHVAVVRSLKPLGKIKHGAAFAQEVSVPLDKDMDPSHYRLVAFVQQQGQGKVIGAAMHSATP
jgi:hypothetical protein